MIKKTTYQELLETRKTISEINQAKKFPITVMLDSVRSLYNVGTIFRTCDSAFIQELVLTGFTPYPPRKEIEKTALGATESVMWRYEKDIVKAINFQKTKGEKIIAVELTNTKKTYCSLEKKDFPICLILGNELVGIDDKVLELCDDAIEIPMFGIKHSLNVGVAAGIVIYEAIRILSQ